MPLHIAIWVQVFIIFASFTRGSKLYGQTDSLKVYDLTDGSIMTVVPKPTYNLSYYGWTNAGLGCYDMKNNRIYYMGEGGDDSWSKYGIYGFDLKTNTSLSPIIMTKYFAPASPFPHVVLEWNLLFCNPKTGELFVWGLSPIPKSNSSAYNLYNVHDIAYSDNNTKVEFKISLIGTYDLPSPSGGFADVTHIFDTKRNAIWFTTNTAIQPTIYYYIDCDNGTLTQIQTNYGSSLITGVYYESTDIIVAVQFDYTKHLWKMLHIDPVSFQIVKEFNWIRFPNAVGMSIPVAIDNEKGIMYEMGFGTPQGWQQNSMIYGIDVETSTIVINMTYEGDLQSTIADDLFVIS